MTPFTLRSLADLNALAVDTIIDVRAPVEFAEDHLPGAINLPVLSDAERAQVGTIYTQESPFKARKIGGALVAKNTAQHLETTLSDKDGGWQPLVYCWRGGQRSGAFATILDQVGWRVQLLQGGYRSYRREVVRLLYDTPLTHRIKLIDGGTGTAKTALLHHLSEQGAQIIDLEALAEHRGSLFGHRDRPQPSQKMFESRLATALAPLDPAKTTFVEAESSKIGNCMLPPALWSAMTSAERVRLSAPLEARQAFLTCAYEDLTEDSAQLLAVIGKLSPYHATEQISAWQAMARAGQWPQLAGELIHAHYDPRYNRAAASKDRQVSELDLPDLSDETLAQTAGKLITRFG